MQMYFSCSFCCFLAVLQHVMPYNQILLKMAGIRLIFILCVLLMFSDKISEFFCSFPYASRIPSTKKCVLSSNFNVSFFLVVSWYLLLNSGDIEINPGPILPQNHPEVF